VENNSDAIVEIAFRFHPYVFGHLVVNLSPFLGAKARTISADIQKSRT